SFAETIDKVLELNPDRIAMFSYAHVPWLRKQQGAFQGHLPEGMEKFHIFKAGVRKFTDAGYLYIGMDHFARPGDELAVAQANRTLHRNFQVTRRKRARTFMEWASVPSAASAKHMRKMIAHSPRINQLSQNAAWRRCAATA